MESNPLPSLSVIKTDNKKTSSSVVPANQNILVPKK